MAACGTKASSVAESSARPTPIQSMLASTVTSSARTEKRAAYCDSTATIGLAISTPITAPVPHSSRLSASRVRRSALARAPSAARTASSPSRRTERARIRFATFEHAITKTSAEAASSTRRTVRGWRNDLVAQLHGVDAEVRLGGIVLGMLSHHRAVRRLQLGTCALNGCAGCQAPEELRHAMHTPRHHRRRHVMRTRDDVRDDLGFLRIGHRRFEHAHDGAHA